MKKLSLLLIALAVATSCKKELTREEKAAELRKDSSDMAEKIATGREADAKKDLLEKATKGN